MCVELTNWWVADQMQQIKGMAFRLRLSGAVSKPPYAATFGNGVVVSDTGKTGATTPVGER